MTPSRVSAKTRSVERAERKAAELQRKIEAAERAARPFEGPQAKTVEKCDNGPYHKQAGTGAR